MIYDDKLEYYMLVVVMSGKLEMKAWDCHSIVDVKGGEMILLRVGCAFRALMKERSCVMFCLFQQRDVQATNWCMQLSKLDITYEQENKTLPIKNALTQFLIQLVRYRRDGVFTRGFKRIKRHALWMLFESYYTLQVL